MFGSRELHETDAVVSIKAHDAVSALLHVACAGWYVTPTLFPLGGPVFISQEGPRFYPHLLKYVRIKLIEAR